MGTDQRSCEFVIALAAPVGADLDLVLNDLRNRIGCYGYEQVDIRLSSLMKNIGGVSEDLSEDGEAKRLDTHMTAGAKIRRKLGQGGALATMAIAAIRAQIPNQEDRIQSRRVYVLRSLKHPEEVRVLREVYGHGVLVLGVHADPERRRDFLVNRQRIDEDDARRQMERDEDEKDEFGQKTRDVFELADAFVSLDRTPSIGEQLDRLLGLLFGHPCETPTQDEHAMFVAFASALRSADLSRQVGAVVLNADDELVACGTNDVPRAGGGLYWPGAALDARDFKRGFDANHVEREGMGRRIAEALNQEYDADFRAKLKKSGLFDLTEYGRAVHAEMEALLVCARVGTSVRGGTVYSTTFPCHNCAKHIIAAGINRVVYVEPYPKSRAADLHGDGIVVEARRGGDGDSRVAFEPFIGIGPRRYVAFFSIALSGRFKVARKEDDGTARAFAKAGATLRFSLDPDSYFDRELLACEILNELPEDPDATEEATN